MVSENDLTRIEQAGIEREKTRRRDPEFFAAVSDLLFRYDPARINFQVNTDEYDAEAGTIIPRLDSCLNIDDVMSVIHEEITKWFGANIAGDRSNHAELAQDIWHLYQNKSLR